MLTHFGVNSLRFVTLAEAREAIAVRLTVKRVIPRSSAGCGEGCWDAVVAYGEVAPLATYDVRTPVAEI